MPMFNNDPEVLSAMFEEMGDLMEHHLGIRPDSFVMIVKAEGVAQTFFAGNDPGEMTQMLLQGTNNHFKTRGGHA